MLTTVEPCQYVLTDYQLSSQHFYTQELKRGGIPSESRVQDLHVERKRVPHCSGPSSHLVCHLVIYFDLKPYHLVDILSIIHPWLYVTPAKGVNIISYLIKVKKSTTKPTTFIISIILRMFDKTS